jgi:hypothetical protein
MIRIMVINDEFNKRFLSSFAGLRLDAVAYAPEGDVICCPACGKS